MVILGLGSAISKRSGLLVQSLGVGRHVEGAQRHTHHGEPAEQHRNVHDARVTEQVLRAPDSLGYHEHIGFMTNAQNLMSAQSANASASMLAWEMP